MSDVKLSEAEVDAGLADIRSLLVSELLIDMRLEDRIRVLGSLGCDRVPDSKFQKRRIAALDIVLAERRERKGES